jgi:hypothetical protein
MVREASAVSAAALVGSIPVNVPSAIATLVSSPDVGVWVLYRDTVVCVARVSGEAPPHPVRASRLTSTRSGAMSNENRLTFVWGRSVGGRVNIIQLCMAPIAALAAAPFAQPVPPSSALNGFGQTRD